MRAAGILAGTQFGKIAPPLAGFLVERFGWPALGWGVAAAGIAGVAAIAPLELRCSISQ